MLKQGAVLLVLAVLLAGCASTTGTKSSRGSRYVITAEEIAESSFSDAFQAIQYLRPGLLDQGQRRDVSLGIAEVQVYVDNVRIGGKESLKSIPASNILQIEFLRSSEATIRYGSDHSLGAFLIKTR